MDHNGCYWFAKGHASRPIGTEIDFKPQPQVSFTKIASIAACFILVMLIGGFSWLWNTVSYSLYIDVNPSIELVFNNLNRLKDAKPLNEDGAALLAGLKLKGSPEDVIINLIKAADDKGFISTQGDSPAVLITVAARGGKAPEAIGTLLSDILLRNDYTDLVQIEICDKDFLDMAAELGVSPGKLKLAERLYASNQSVDVRELVKKPVKVLMTEIRYAEGKGVPQPENGNNPQGRNVQNNSDNGKNSQMNPNPAQKNANENGGGNGEDNPNKGAGNNSGSTGEDNPNKGSGNNSGSTGEDNPNKGSGNNSGSTGGENPNSGSGNNSGNAGEDNPNKGSGNNSGNTGGDNPNKGPGNNSGKTEP